MCGSSRGSWRGLGRWSRALRRWEAETLVRGMEEELTLSLDEQMVENFCVNRDMAPWFHGTMGRREAEQVLTDRGRNDGAFLVRFSESQPAKFTLSYLKVHTGTGKREVKNCLVENMGRDGGYALLEGSRSRQQRTYSSLQSFVKHNASRLKYGVSGGCCRGIIIILTRCRDQVPSELSRQCNNELADLRAVCDHQMDAYTAFSSETVVDSQETPGNGGDYHASMLFSRSPVLRAQSEYQAYGGLALPESGTNSAYSGFSLDALSGVHDQTNTSDSNSSFVSSSQSLRQFEETDYGYNVMAFMGPQSSTQNGKETKSDDVYANFDTFAAAAGMFASESRELAARQEQMVSLSRSPTRPSSTQWQCDQEENHHDVYGSFASVQVSSIAPPSAPKLPVTIRPLDMSSASIASSSDYGSFASFTDSEISDQLILTASPETNASENTGLGPPPPPPRSILLRPSQPSADEMYGNFSSMTIDDRRLESSRNTSTFDASASMPDLRQMVGDGGLGPPPPPLAHSFSTAGPGLDKMGDLESKPASVSTELKTSMFAHASALEELNAGMAFYKQQMLDEAILRFVVARETARETQDKVVEARALGNLGTVYLDRKNPRQAVECYQKCLEITRSIGDTKRERTILNNIVLAFVACEEFPEALAYCQVQLEMTANATNRRKILSRMSLLRERMARAAAAAEKQDAAHAAVAFGA